MSARVLFADANTRVYFQPNANFFGTSSITFRAWDRSNGSANGASGSTRRRAAARRAFSAVFDSASVTVNSVNDQPLFAGLNGTPTYTEDGAAVVLDNNALLSDVELDAANNYDGATLTLVRSTGSQSGRRVQRRQRHADLRRDRRDRWAGTGQVGTYTQVNGTLVITFNSSATSAAVDSVLQQLHLPQHQRQLRRRPRSRSTTRSATATPARRARRSRRASAPAASWSTSRPSTTRRRSTSTTTIRAPRPAPTTTGCTSRPARPWRSPTATA